MGKRLITQARGAGGPRYRANSHRFFGRIEYPAPAKELTRGTVLDIVDCPGHSAPLMLIKYDNGTDALLPAPLGIKVGAVVFSGEGAPLGLGNIVPVGDVPSGYPIYDIERIPYNGPELVRTSGSSATVVGKEGGKVLVRMPSRQNMLLDPRCRVTIGTIAGGGRTEKPFVKAGTKYLALYAKGGKIFPKVSGVAKNSVDHPFGGTHRRSLGLPTTTRRKGTPPGRKVGLLSARRTGCGK